MFALDRSSVTAVVLVAALAICGLSAEAEAQVSSDRIAALSDFHGYFPCMDCHGDQETVATPRILEEEHYEPLAWEDDDGTVSYVPFGQLVSIADLLGQHNTGSIEGDNLARVGARLNIASYMESNGLSPADSVWTLVHGGGNLWCMSCHDTDDRDKLVKPNGDLLTFNESQFLCGSCHGPILLDWELGIHGKTVGYWDPDQGDEEMTVRLLCVECHGPHRPTFLSMQPMAAPVLRVDGPGTGAHHGDETTADAHPEESAH